MSDGLTPEQAQEALAWFGSEMVAGVMLVVIVLYWWSQR